MKKIMLSCAMFAAFSLAAKAQMTFQKTAKGVQYHLFTANPGERIKLNDVITFHVIQKTDKDSVLFSSYAAGHPVKIQVQASQNVGDLMDLFPLLTAKDSVVARVPADSIFKQHEQERPAFLPKGSNILFTIKIEKVQSLPEAIAERNVALEKLKASETAEASKYIAAHNLMVKTTPSGLKYVVTRPSAKRKALAGDTVFVNYTGRTLNGKVFDSSIEADAKTAGLQQPGRTYEPIKVVVGKGQVIKGWDEALLLLNEGSKAQLIIPSDLAYGSQGAGNDIAPFSTLLFDIEVVNIKPTKHVAAARPPAKKTPVRKTAYKKKN